ncbi:MAG: class I SAM-dependent methyltransferase [Chitinophagaceae bacterium]|nr:class I SAM-dependent methyltransferase [Chitinophagaceae bacterium]
MTNLEDKSKEKMRGFVVDIDSTGKARKKFLEKKESGGRKNLEYVISDVTKLPFADGSLDVIISRMTMQYLDKEQQDRLLSEISRVLKGGGMCIIQTTTDEIDNDTYNKIFIEITKIISKSSDFKRSFPRFSSFTKYNDFEEKYGLKPVFGSKLTLFPFSVAAFVERFNIDPKELEDLFVSESKAHPELFEIIDGQLCLKSRLLDLRLKKTD